MLNLLLHILIFILSLGVTWLALVWLKLPDSIVRIVFLLILIVLVIASFKYYPFVTL